MAFLEALGLSEELGSFTGRKRVQKIIYLLKQFPGNDLPFGYTWYLHGPYSPELTRTLLDSAEGATRHELTKDELGTINRMRNFLADDFYSVDRLELIVSLIYLIKHGPDEGYDAKRKIFEFIQRQKPQFSKRDIASAWKKIEDSRIWESYLKRLGDR